VAKVVQTYEDDERRTTMSVRRIARAVVTTAMLFAFLAFPSSAGAGGFCQEGKATEGSGTTVTMGKNCFTPTVLRVEPGSDVTWVNKDPEAHTVTGVAGAWGSGHKEAAPGTRMVFSFKEPGVYSYTCLLHPGMAGTIVVGDGTGKGAAVEEIDVEPVSASEDRAASSAARPVEQSSTTGAWAGIAIAAAALGGGAGYGLGRRRREAGIAA
jgi:plastocyanin